ncbi:MAG: HlyD family efflux transporter periplasmic adaptor subunit [Phycisphaerales bacterium]|nr:HlyD family efflux transporter periplasmic adaptor subunit [Phycisphaerales bacterium]
MRVRRAGVGVGLAALAGAAFAVGAGPIPQPGANTGPDGTESVEDLAARFAGERSYTQASRDAQVGFQISTQVMQVLVRGGERVHVDQELVIGDAGEEAALLEIQRTRANTDLPVKRAEAALELAKVELARMKEAHSRGGATDNELNRAEVSEVIAQIDLETAKWNQAQEGAQLGRLEKRVARYSLLAPFDGIVDMVIVDRGDVIRESEPVLRVVQIDPLLIDVQTPIDIAMGLALKKGDPAWVLLEVPSNPVLTKGKVIEVSPMANFAARKLRIRVEVANPELWPAGLAAWVRFDNPGEPWNGMLRAEAGAAPEPAAAGASGDQ